MTKRDLIDETFSDLYYPGSKKKRAEKKPVKEELPEPTWDSVSYKKWVGNKEIEFFTIGALAKALHRPLITIRHWMKEGNLPLSPYRLPTKADKHGKDHAGRRLYTRAMIEAAVDIFTQAGLLHAKRVNWLANEYVTDAITKAWIRIKQEENK